MNFLTEPVARMLLRRIAGCPGYPDVEGEKLAVAALCESTLGVSHAEAVIERFGDGFPTPDRLREVAQDLQEQFLRRRA